MIEMSALVPVLIAAVVTAVPLVLNRRRAKAEVDSAAVVMSTQTNTMVRESYRELLIEQREARVRAEAELDEMRVEIRMLRADVDKLRADLLAEQRARQAADRKFDRLWGWAERAIAAMETAGTTVPPLPPGMTDVVE